MQIKVALGALAIFVLAACGGGSSGGGSVNPVPNPSQPPQSSGNIPQSATVAGSSAWVAPQSQRTLYFLTSDTSTGATCTGGCLAIWPVFAPSAGAQASGNMTVITRSDGTGQQWAYQGHPLYMYSGDNAGLQSNGEGIVQGSGVWHVARPTASTGGGGTGGGCTGIYC